MDSTIENISIDPEYVDGSSGKLVCLKLNSKLCVGNSCENSIHWIGPLNDSKLSSGPPENASDVGTSEGAGVERECPIASFQIAVGTYCEINVAHRSNAPMDASSW